MLEIGKTKKKRKKKAVYTVKKVVVCGRAGTAVLVCRGLGGKNDDAE